VAPRLFSLVENSPDGFIFTRRLDPAALEDRVFALLAPDCDTARAALAPLADTAIGLILTPGSALVWDDRDPSRIHLTFPDSLRAELANWIRPCLTLLEMARTRKRATADEETALRLSHQFFHESIAANSISDLSGSITECNEAFLRMWGYPNKREVIGKGIPLFLHDPNQAAAIVEALNRTGTWEGDYTARRKNGSTFIAHGLASGITDETGQRIGYQSSVVDITGRVQAEEEVRNLIACAPFGAHLYELTPDGQLVFKGANSAADVILGMNHRQMIGQTLEQIFPALQKTRIPDAYRQTAGTGKRFDDDEFLYAEDGSIAEVFEVHAFQTGPNRMAAFFLNITERKRSEQTLRESEEHLRLSLQSIGDAVIATDPEGRVVRMNPTAERLTGWTFSDAAGKPLTDLLHLVDPKSGIPVENPVERSLKTGGSGGRMTPANLIASGGAVYQIEDSCSPILSPDGTLTGVILVFRDVTLENRNRDELQKMQRLQSVGALAGGIAHDFNNILMGILGNFSIARISLTPDHPAWTFLNEAERSIHRGTHLAKQLLTFSDDRSRTNEPIHLRELVEETVPLDLTGSSVRAEVTGEEPLWRVEADRSQIQQVLSNLTLNAREAMPNGGRLDLTLHNVDNTAGGLPFLKSRKYIRITVRDEGAGIEPRNLDRIFEPYFSTKQRNSGLGLATALSIVTRHGGHISAESTPGQGTTFTLHLPAIGPNPVPESPAAQAPASFPVNGSARILLMDDDEAILHVLARWLKDMGHTVETAFDGQQALTLFARSKRDGEPFDALILDLTLPGGIGGDEVLRRIRRTDPETKAILSSGYSDGPIVTHYAAHGFKGVLLKPYTQAELKNKLHEVLGC
jgi:PAS domain S-box-containing protein